MRRSGAAAARAFVAVAAPRRAREGAAVAFCFLLSRFFDEVEVGGGEV